MPSCGKADVFVEELIYDELTMGVPASGTFGLGTAITLGDDRLVLGASLASSSESPTLSGVAYELSPTRTTVTRELTGARSEPFDLFGGTMVMSEDTVVIGAPAKNTTAGTGSGAVYIFHFGLELGEACSDDEACASGFCSDGVCCNAPCGLCQVCAVESGAAIDGQCAPVDSGSDPDDECADEGPCATDGACDGAGQCRMYENGTVCDAGICVDGSCSTIDVSCEDPDTLLQIIPSNAPPEVRTVCSPYRCRDDACLQSCTSTADCSEGYSCNAVTRACDRSEFATVDHRGGCRTSPLGSSEQPLPTGLWLGALGLWALRARSRRQKS